MNQLHLTTAPMRCRLASAVLGVLLPQTHLLAAGWLTSAVLLAVGLMDTRLKQRLQRA